MTSENIEIIKYWFSESFEPVPFQPDEWDEEWNDLLNSWDDFFLVVGGCLRGNGIKKIQHYKTNISNLFEKLKPRPIEDLYRRETQKQKRKLAEAFNCKYEGESVNIFRDYLNRCYTDYTVEGTYHSPYMSIVQSSGYGKSKLCKEFALTDKDWLTVYICLRENISMGYPFGHIEAIDYLTSRSLKSGDVTNWIDAWYYLRVISFISYEYKPANNDPAKYLEDIETNLDLYIENYIVIQTHESNEKSSPEFQGNETEKKLFWTLCEDENFANRLHHLVEKLIDELTKKKFKTFEAKVLIIVDEAKLLIQQSLPETMNYSLFRAFRTSLKHVKGNVFAALVDTTSNISNFSPTSVNDPSFRMGQDEHNKQLFNPFHWLITIDVLSNKNGLSKYDIFTLGRPLWMKSLDGKKQVYLEALRNFAWQKILCSTDVNAPITRNTAIAMIAILTGMSISPLSTTAVTLVASHMATCFCIENDRKSLHISYPVEPILSEAALFNLHKLTKTSKFTNILESLKFFFRVGELNVGHNGELVAKLLLLLIKYSLSDAFQDCHLSEFLNSLLCHARNSSKTSTEILAKGMLSFTCFTKIIRGHSTFQELWQHDEPNEILKALYIRRAAIQFPDNQPGADLLIPVKISSKEFKYVLVQVKNSYSYDMKKVESNIKPNFVFGSKNKKWIEHYCGKSISINLGGDKKDPVLSNRGDVIHIYGLDSFKYLFTSDWSTIKEELSLILGEKSYIANADDTEKKRMLQLDPILEMVVKKAWNI